MADEHPDNTSMKVDDSGRPDHRVSPPTTGWGYPGTQQLSSSEWQDQVDSACARAIDAAKKLAHVRSRKVDSPDKENDTSRSSQSNSNAQNRSEDMASERRRATEQPEDIKQHLAKAQKAWDDAQEELKALHERIVQEVKKAESAQVATNSDRYQDQFEKAAILREAETNIFRSFQDQIEKTLALADQILSSNQISMHDGENNEIEPVSDLSLSHQVHDTGPGGSTTARIEGVLRFETYNGEKVVAFTGIGQMQLPTSSAKDDPRIRSARKKTSR